MQGEPIQFLAESHYGVRSSKDSSLNKEQGGVTGIAGKSRDADGPDAGITADTSASPSFLRTAPAPGRR
jgi:hypothetical protein